MSVRNKHQLLNLTNPMTDKKRYAVVTSFYVMANDEEDAIQRAKSLAARQDTQKSDGCCVEEVYSAVF